MYYVAFFIYDPPFFTNLINELIKQDFSEVRIRNNQQDFNLDSLEISSILNDSVIWFPQPWYLYGHQLHESIDRSFPGLPLLGGTSVRAIDNLLEWFADHYSWSIFTWGGVDPLLSIAFISSNKNLFERFIKLESKIVITTQKQQNAAQELLLSNSTIFSSSHVLDFMANNTFSNRNTGLISTYEVLESFKKHRQILLFNVFKNPGDRVWEACECDIQPPWLITSGYHENNNSIILNYNDIQEVESNEELFKIASYNLFSNPQDDEFQEICIIEYPIQVMKIDPNTSALVPSLMSQKLAVIQLKTKESFNDFCRDHINSESDVLFVVPQGVNLVQLIKLIPKIERQDSMNYDFEYINDILTITQWFYGINRSRRDTKHSLFMSNNNELLNKLDSLIVDDDYCLISCL
jgi:hypothetical protein